MIKKYILYLVRWQLSTPILYLCIILLNSILGPTWTTVIANLIGGFIFFWVDRYIFKVVFSGELWEMCWDRKCFDCGKTNTKTYRLVKKDNYDKSDDRCPEFRCKKCSVIKYSKMFGNR